MTIIDMHQYLSPWSTLFQPDLLPLRALLLGRVRPHWTGNDWVMVDNHAHAIRQQLSWGLMQYKPHGSVPWDPW